MIVFTIPYPPTKKGKTAFCRAYGLNAYYSGKHWTQRKKDAEALHLMVRLAMKKAGVRRKVLVGPVEVRFYWDDGLDADNHAVMGKAFLDAMVQYILPDDNRKWVRKVSHEFWDNDELYFKATNGKENYGPGGFQYMPCCEEVKILGNIHDNQELLEVQNEAD